MNFRRYCRVEAVHIVDEFMRNTHRLIVIGRDFDGRRCYLKGDGDWEPITEGASNADAGIELPEGVLDAIVSKYNGTTAPQPATERHLDDAIQIRDRLLALVESRPFTVVTGEAHIMERN